MSYPSAIARLGAAATTLGVPTIGNDAEQHLNDLVGRRTRTHRGIGLCAIGRSRATDRHQRGEADQGQRLRIELDKVNPHTGSNVLGELFVVDGQQAQCFPVIQADSPSRRTPVEPVEPYLNTPPRPLPGGVGTQTRPGLG